MTMESEEDWSVDNDWGGINFDQDGIERERVILKNLPAELVNDGIRNICEAYGKVINVNRPPEKNYAFVTFTSPA